MARTTESNATAPEYNAEIDALLLRGLIGTAAVQTSLDDERDIFAEHNAADYHKMPATKQ